MSYFSCSYVLLHHVMGELEGHHNSWGYVEGGMGRVSTAIATAAQSHGAEITTDTVSVQLQYCVMYNEKHCKCKNMSYSFPTVEI